MELLLKNVLKEGFFGILLTFDTIIYGLIGGAFKVFIAVAEARLLTSEAYYDIAGRVYMLVGVMMLFVLSYSILRAIIDPDQATKGELGPKMIQRIIIAVVGLALTPAIFNLLYQAQGLFIEKDVLAQIFFKSNQDLALKDKDGNAIVTDPDTGKALVIDDQIKTIGGSVTANSIWQAFFQPAEGFKAEDIKTDADQYFADATLGWIGCGAGAIASAALATGVLVIPVIGWIASPLIMGATVVTCINAASKTKAAQTTSQATGGKDLTLEQAYTLTSGGGSFSIYVAFLNNFVEKKEISYLYLISTICGLFVLYSFVSFTIDMGIRAAKLAYLQIVAPVPLVMQVIPKYKDTFTKWYKSVFSAFAEVFIRISVVYIVVYVICHLTDMFSSISKGFANSDLNTIEVALAYAALIIGLIAFCRKAPNIIQQTLGISGGDLKFGLGEKLKDGGVFAATGIAAGGITSGVRRFNNFNKDKWMKEHGFNPGDKNGERQARAAQLLAGVGGLGAGMGRAGWNQFGDIFGGKPKNEANNWHDAMEQGEKAAQQHMDANAKAEARRTRHFNALKNEEAAKKEYNEAKEAQAQLNAQLAANPNDDALKTAKEAADKRVEAAEAAYTKAQDEVMASTAVGAFADTQRRKIRAWSTGSVDMSTEETALKLAGDMKGLQDTLRAEALKKDETSKALNAQYEKLRTETIGDYRAGWDEESYNRELNRRLSADGEFTSRRDAYTTAATALTTAEERLRTASRELDAAREELKRDPTNTAKRDQVTQKERDLEQRRIDLAAAQSDADSKRTAMLEKQDEIKAKIDIEAKLSEEEKQVLRADLQARVDAAKQVSEAAQDAWVQAQLAKGDSETSRIVEAAVTPYLEFLQTHGTDQVVRSIDSVTGEEESISVSELVSQFGDVASRRGRIDSAVVAKSSTFELKDDNSGEVKDVFTFDPSTKTYTDREGHTYSPGELSAHVTTMMRKMRTDNPSATPKFEGKTAANQAKDTGKKVGINTPRSEGYRQKIQRKREAEKK